MEVRDISKHFGGLRAVSSVSFKVQPGEIVGVIGPNGAGKTTLFAVLSSFLFKRLFETGHTLFFGLLLVLVIVWAPSGLLGHRIRKTVPGAER